MRTILFAGAIQQPWWAALLWLLPIVLLAVPVIYFTGQWLINERYPSETPPWLFFFKRDPVASASAPSARFELADGTGSLPIPSTEMMLDSTVPQLHSTPVRVRVRAIGRDHSITALDGTVRFRSSAGMAFQTLRPNDSRALRNLSEIELPGDPPQVLRYRSGHLGDGDHARARRRARR
jgi:hypothetical protein